MKVQKFKRYKPQYFKNLEGLPFAPKPPTLYSAGPGPILSTLNFGFCPRLNAENLFTDLVKNRPYSTEITNLEQLFFLNLLLLFLVVEAVEHKQDQGKPFLLELVLINF